MSKKRKKKKKKKQKKADKEKGVDRFGTQLGTNRAKINAALSKTPLTLKQLVKKAGVSYAPSEHLARLVARRLIRKTEDGFVLVQKSKSGD